MVHWGSMPGDYLSFSIKPLIILGIRMNAYAYAKNLEI